MTRQELIEALAGIEYEQDKSLVSSGTPWTHVGDYSREHYREHARLLMPVIVGFVADWFLEQERTHWQLTIDEAVKEWRDEMA